MTTLTRKEVIITLALVLALGLSIGGYLGVSYRYQKYQDLYDNQLDVGKVINEDIKYLNMCYDKMIKCCEVEK